MAGADLHGANLVGADLDGANLVQANLRGARLQAANLRDANLQGSTLGGANLTVAELPHTNLAGADLRGADLRKAELLATNLAHSDLRGVNLTGARLSLVDFTGACYDRLTRWPRGFDPRKHGAILTPWSPRPESDSSGCVHTTSEGASRLGGEPAGMRNRVELNKGVWTKRWNRLQVLTLLLAVLVILCLLTAKW